MVKDRLEKFQRIITEKGIDGFIVFSPKNRRYMSGFTGTAGILFITPKSAFLFTDFRYIEQANKETEVYQVIKHDFPPLTAVKEVVDRLPIETIGFEGDFVTYKQFNELQEVFKNQKLISEVGLIESMRMIKSKEEISILAKAAEITDKAFSHVLDIIKPGLREIDLALELEFFMRREGASGTSFTTIVASGKRSALPHGIASEKIIKKGDFVTCDFGCRYKGYCSDMTRTVVIGEPTAKQKEVYQTVLNAQQIGVNTIRSGLSAREVDKESRDYIVKKGYGDYFGHGLGHSLGLAIHENPSLSPRDNTELLENMVVTIEPGIYLPEWGGVRIEDLVVIKNNGHHNLAHSQKELIII